MSKLWLAVALSSFMALGAGPVSAQQDADPDDEGRVHFRLGRAYYDSGRFDDAAREFQQAYDLTQRAALLYNIFVAHRDAGNLAAAITALRAYLQRVPDADQREQLEARLAVMERQLRDQGDDPQPEPTAPPSATAAVIAPAGPSSGGGGMWTPGWIIAGVGGAAIVAGIVTGAMALGEQSSLQSMCDAGGCNPGFEGHRDTLGLLSGLTDVLLIGGLAVAATGVVLAFVISDGGGSSDQPRASVVCGPDGCMGALLGSF